MLGIPTKVAIDLGTSTTLVALPNRGIILREPTVIARELPSSQVVAVGAEAHAMLGRTPGTLVADRPLRSGAIANFRTTEILIRALLQRTHPLYRFMRPDVALAVSAGLTSTERRAAVEATVAAGARAAYTVKQSLAAALGAGLQVSEPAGTMVITLGGGTTEVAVLALGDTVAVHSERFGGRDIDIAISSYLRKKYNLVIGEQTAEHIKHEVGAALPLKKELSLEVSGSNAVTGLPESIQVHTADVIAAIKPALTTILGAVKTVLQQTPPELASDVMDKGIILTGGMSQLRKLDELLTRVTGVPCQVAEDPATCVIRGTQLVAENLEAFKKSVLWAAR